MDEAVLFFSHKDMSWDEAEKTLLVKLSYIKQGLSYISRSLCLHRNVVKGAEQLVEKQGGREESVGSAADGLFKALFVSTGLTCFRVHSRWITITRF
ncbi:hypothetical protein BDA96_03G110600 [Sorghum bicolor]|uniref:Uncharacterized protein n=1 Tax=Sorghum bicolor TaxID=4558 RepID=A0A921RDB0_SORBI|nr:hypothetical protein BDA96_03G110600 [Sorghum bicolor]